MKLMLGTSVGIALVLTTLGIAGNQSLVAQPSQPIARLTKVEGKVEVKSYAPETPWRLAKAGSQLVYGDVLRVQRTANAEIQCLSNPSIKRIVPNDGIPWGVATACPSSNR